MSTTTHTQAPAPAQAAEAPEAPAKQAEAPKPAAPTPAADRKARAAQKAAQKPAEAKAPAEKPAEAKGQSSVDLFKARAAAKKAEAEAPKAEPAKAEPKAKEAKVKAEPKVKEAVVQPVLPKDKRPAKGAVARQQVIDDKNKLNNYARGWHVHTVWLLEDEFMGTEELHLSFDRRFGDCQFWFTNPETKKWEHMHTEFQVGSDIEAVRKFGLKAEPHFRTRTSLK